MQKQSRASHFKHVNCPLCKRENSEPVLCCRDYNWGTPGVFKYVRCRTCGLVYENPRPVEDEIIFLYPGDYGTIVRNPKQNPEPKINAPVHRARSRLIEHFTPAAPGSILDIGCGSGFFLEFMHRRGWTVFGMDSSAEHVCYARNALGLQNVREDVWPPNQDPNIQVQVVSMFHVIEHLPSPIQSLLAVKKLLPPGGIVVLETPNVKSLPAKLFGSRWVTLDAPRHLTLFSRITLRGCLHMAGFQLVTMKTFSPSTMEYTESMRYLLGDLGFSRYKKTFGSSPDHKEMETHKSTSHRDSDGQSTKKSLQGVEQAVFKSLNLLATWFGVGCNLLAVAQKPKY